MKSFGKFILLLLVTILIVPNYMVYADNQTKANPKGVGEFLKTLDSSNYEIHYVGVYEGYTTTPNRTRGIINVNVTIKEKPVLLVLTSYEPVNWNISRDLKTKIVGVVISGYYKQTSSGLKGIPTLSLSYEEGDKLYFMGRCETQDKYLDVVDNINRLFGKKPVTVQGKYSAANIKIDGKCSITYDEDKEKKSTGKVKFVSPRYSGNITANGLTVSYKGAGGSSFFKTNVGHQKGKYYFETKIGLGKESKAPNTWTSIGIVTEDAIDMFAPEDGDYGYVYKAIDTWFGPIKPENVKTNDIIGVAMDLDKGKVFFSLNGKWVNGVPGSETGMNIKLNRKYFAAVSAGQSKIDPYTSDTWTGRFSKNTFSYTIPKGYMPYEY